MVEITSPDFTVDENWSEAARWTTNCRSVSAFDATSNDTPDTSGIFTGAWPELSTIVTVLSGATCVPTGGVTEMTLPAAIVSLDAVGGFAA